MLYSKILGILAMSPRSGVHTLQTTTPQHLQPSTMSLAQAPTRPLVILFTLTPLGPYVVLFHSSRMPRSPFANLMFKDVVSLMQRRVCETKRERWGSNWARIWRQV